MPPSAEKFQRRIYRIDLSRPLNKIKSGGTGLHPTSYVHGPLIQKGFLTMQTAKQISVSLVNKPGRLADMLTALAKEKVTFRALAVMDSGERGTVRFVPDDYDAAIGVLQGMNVHYEVADVLLAELPSQSGAFRKVCEKLAGEHLNIDYAYCSFVNGKGGVLAVVRVNDLAKAQRVLGEKATASRAVRRPGRRPSYAR